MLCNNCNESIVLPDGSNVITCTKNIAVKYNDKYICTACNEAFMLFSSDNKPRKKIIVKKVEIKKAKSKNLFVCSSCKKSYEGTQCNSCNKPNPLYMRKQKKKKKKKKKK